MVLAFLHRPGQSRIVVGKGAVKEVIADAVYQ